ncbi:MAG: NADH-quinone oxidoreductase subunit C [Firmicutes bacterium]|nr:NADH-quinone oxidoreductase subunit C [Bacillota bacterium]
MQYYKKIGITKDQIVPIAEKMRKQGVLLAMIHGFVTDEGKLNISYEYQLGDTMESYTIEIDKNDSLPSISDIYDLGAQWAEREINELIGAQFDGLDTSKRLFMPESMLEGQGQIFVTPMDELIDKAHGTKKLEEEK